MSSPRIHIIQSLSSSILLYPIFKNNVIPFGLGVVLIDLDHIIQYMSDTKSFDMRGFLAYFDVLSNNLTDNYLGLNFFHTLEFYALFLLMGLKFPFFHYALMGFLFHHLLDQWSLMKRDRTFVRAFSIVEYFIRRKQGKYIVTLEELLKQINFDLTKANDLTAWLDKWGIVLETDVALVTRKTPGLSDA